MHEILRYARTEAWVNLSWIALLTLAVTLSSSAPGAESKTAVADPRLEKKVKLSTAQASVQDVVQALVQQVGLRYDWQRSFNQTDPVCRQWVRNVAIDGITCREALDQILTPVNLRYQVENGVLALYKPQKGQPAADDPRLDQKVKYSVARASVQDVVMQLAQQVGLRYDFEKSLNQTRPLCQRWVTNVAIDGKTCHAALNDLLSPVGLRYQIEEGAIVLYRRQ